MLVLAACARVRVAECFGCGALSALLPGRRKPGSHDVDRGSAVAGGAEARAGFGMRVGCTMCVCSCVVAADDLMMCTRCVRSCCRVGVLMTRDVCVGRGEGEGGEAVTQGYQTLGRGRTADVAAVAVAAGWHDG